MAQLAIKGHTTRGREVIEFLEMLGGKNVNSLKGIFPDFCYTINSSNNIIRILILEHRTQYDVLILESLLNKCPHKVGDKVRFEGHECNIIKMTWDDGKMLCLTDFCGGYVVHACKLKPYKEETTGDKKTTITFEYIVNDKNEMQLVIPDKIELKLRFGKFIIKDKKSQYPKTYEECCVILRYDAHRINNDGVTVRGYKWELINTFQKLLICRDAYWKIAGDWKPNYKNPNKDTFYFLFNNGECIEKGQAQYPINKVLIFPTEEMRDAFFENFKDLIEQCKELL